MTKIYRGMTTTTSRHGRIVRWFKGKESKGRKIRLYAEPGTVAFNDEYDAAIEGRTAPRDAGSPAKTEQRVPRRVVAKMTGKESFDEQSLRWLVDHYFRSPWFTTLGGGKAARENDLIRICESVDPDSGLPRGDLRYRSMRARHVQQIMSEINAPGVGNRLIGSLSVVFSFGMSPLGEFERDQLCYFNPCARVERREPENGDEGFYEWKPRDCLRFEARWKVGTMQRLAYEIAMFTGLRNSDIRIVGPDFINEDGWFDMKETKGRDSQFYRKLYRPKTKRIEKPVNGGLQDVIDATPDAGANSWVVNKWGNTFSCSSSFGAWMKKAIRAAVGDDARDRKTFAEWMADGNFHGLRKRSTAALADEGASLIELQQHGNWTGLKNPAKYSKGADKRRAAMSAVDKVAKARAGRGVDPVVVPFKKTGTA